MTKKILVPLDLDYGRAVKGLGQITDDISDFFSNTRSYSLVLFTGGSDVTPTLYSDTSPRGICCCNPERDVLEMKIFERALAHGIKMTGICRGAQFISVMSGGRMIHHLDGHAGQNHLVETTRGEVFEINSLHHQMIIPPKDGYIVGWSKDRQSKEYIGDGDEEVHYPYPETEIVLLPRTKCYGVQWHPEMMNERTPGYLYYHQEIRKFLEMNISEFAKTYLPLFKSMETGK